MGGLIVFVGWGSSMPVNMGDVLMVAMHESLCHMLLCAFLAVVQPEVEEAKAEVFETMHE